MQIAHGMVRPQGGFEKHKELQPARQGREAEPIKTLIKATIAKTFERRPLEPIDLGINVGQRLGRDRLEILTMRNRGNLLEMLAVELGFLIGIRVRIGVDGVNGNTQVSRELSGLARLQALRDVAFAVGEKDDRLAFCRGILQAEQGPGDGVTGIGRTFLRTDARLQTVENLEQGLVIQSCRAGRV